LRIIGYYLGLENKLGKDKVTMFIVGSLEALETICAVCSHVIQHANPVTLLRFLSFVELHVPSTYLNKGRFKKIVLFGGL
jgi:hypothetical protein